MLLFLCFYKSCLFLVLLLTILIQKYIKSMKLQTKSTKKFQFNDKNQEIVRI